MRLAPLAAGASGAAGCRRRKRRRGCTRGRGGTGMAGVRDAGVRGMGMGRVPACDAMETQMRVFTVR